MSRPSVAVTGAADQIVDGTFVVDVREDDEFAAGHIEGAISSRSGRWPAASMRCRRISRSWR